MLPSIPLPMVSGADSKVGLTMSVFLTSPIVQSAPAVLDPPALPPVSKDDARFWRFYVL